MDVQILWDDLVLRTSNFSLGALKDVQEWMDGAKWRSRPFSLANILSVKFGKKWQLGSKLVWFLHRLGASESHAWPKKVRSMRIPKPEHHGPISVQSVFWWAWSATWLKSKHVGNWRKLLFPKNISGGYPGVWGPELLAAITHQYLLKWKFAVSLDFSHAFDTINVKMVQEALLPCVDYAPH